MIRFYFRSFPYTILKQTQNPSKIRRLDCSSLVDFSEILKIISENLELLYLDILKSLELKLSVPVSEMSMWLVF